MHQLKRALTGVAIAALSACSGGSSNDTNTIPNGTTLKVALLETTDIHQNLLSYNYYSLAPDATLGLERTSALVNAARVENANTVLFDDGDNIQGSLLGDFQAQASPITCSSTLALHKVMNYMRYDGGGLGNHEFNYGLDFLAQVTNTDMGLFDVKKPNNCGAPAYPLVLSNVDGVTSKSPIFKPYAIINKNFTATKPDGQTVSVKFNVGIMSFVPPQIMDWDAKNLVGKVVVNGVVESANKYIPDIRAKGADIVVALSHGGLDASPYSPKMENGSYHLAGTGIDALLIGHSHLIFPKAKETGAAPVDGSFLALKATAPVGAVDEIKGLVNGVPTVMAQSWGRRLGIIQMTFVYQDGKWVQQKDKVNVESHGFKYTDGTTIVAADAAVAPLIDTEHKATIAYASQSLGTTTDFQMSAYFALVGDVTAIQIVNQAQRDYVKNIIATSNDPTLAGYKNIPVLSTSAPFKAGRNGASDFTDVAPAATPISTVALQVRNPGDLYVFSNNNLQAVKIKGSDVKAWLEVVAKQFAQIDPTKTTEQDLVPSYSTIFNFDVFYADNNGLKYQFDVTKPIGSRVVNLNYNGAPIADSSDFIVATNDFRAGGNLIPALDGSTRIIKSPDANQTIVSDYIKKQGTLTLTKNGSARPWSFLPVATAGPIILRVQPGKLAVAQKLGLARITSEGALDASGFAKYAVDLSK